MFVFNLTMEQLLAIRKDCADILSTHDASLNIAFNTKTLSFFEYMEGWEWEDLAYSDIVFYGDDIDEMIGKILSYIGEEIPETREESDFLAAMGIIELNSDNHIALTMESGTSWDENKIGSFLMSHAPFFIRPYKENRMEIVNSNGEWLIRTSKIIDADYVGDCLYFMTESGHKYKFIPFEAN